MDDNETIADIIAEKRFDATTRDQFDSAYIVDLCDRIDAAHKREKSEWVNANAGLAKLVDIEKLGDAAKLREALEFCVKGMCGFCRMDAEARGMTTRCVRGCEALLKAKAALDAPPRNCIDKVFVLVKADAFEDETDRYKVFSSFQSANEWMRRDYISQQRKEEMADSMGVMKDDPAFFHDQPVPSSDSESAELFLGESHVVRWCIYEKELITEGGGDAD